MDEVGGDREGWSSGLRGVWRWQIWLEIERGDLSYLFAMDSISCGARTQKHNLI